MSQTFQLDPRLSNDGAKVLDLKLNRVLLVNNALFPWIILIPRRKNMREIIDLRKNDRTALMEEISFISIVMMEVFSPDKLNVATLGNVVPQLHIHIIARYINDVAWPSPVFGKDKQAYTKEKYQVVIKQLKDTINSKNTQEVKNGK